MLLRAALPQLRFDPVAALALLHYQQRYIATTYKCHRKRQLPRLDSLQLQLSL